MGRKVGPIKWEGRNVWWLICRSHADAGGNGAASSSGIDLSLCHGFRVLRRLDISKRRVDAVVQQLVDFRARDRYAATSGGLRPGAKRMGEDPSAAGLSAAQNPAALITGAVFSRLVIA